MPLIKDPQNYLSTCLAQLIELNGQDLFIKAESYPRVRANGTVQALELERIGEKDVLRILDSLLNQSQKESLEKNKSVDFAFSLMGTTQRFRANAFLQQGMHSLVIRRLWKTIPSFEELHIPQVMKKIALERTGIILVGGLAASGKTTTVNAMLHLMNQQTKRHIITVEDPVEYLHEDRQCIINQREIGQDAHDFSSALRYVVRQSPDTIMIGEMRDLDTFNFALSASEVGRLVIATIHAKTVQQIIDRILGFFPSEKRDMILNHLSYHITGFTVQKLLPTKDAKSMIPAFEVMLGNAVIRNLIREKDFQKIPQAIRNGAEEGMQTMDQALFQLWKDGRITAEDALAASERPHDLEQQIRGINIESHKTRILGV